MLTNKGRNINPAINFKLNSTYLSKTFVKDVRSGIQNPKFKSKIEEEEKYFLDHLEQNVEKKERKRNMTKAHFQNPTCTCF